VLAELVCYFLLANTGRRTFNPLGDKDRILEKLDEVAEELEDDMNRSGWTGRTVTLKYKLETYQGKFTRLYRSSPGYFSN